MDKDLNGDGNIAVAKTAATYIKDKKPNFLFVHLHDVDSVGHNAGHGTLEYYEAIERTDTHIGTILYSIREAGILAKTCYYFHG